MKFRHNNLFLFTNPFVLSTDFAESFFEAEDDVDEMQARLELVNLLVTYKGSIGDSRHDALNRKSSVKNKYNNCLVTCKQQWYNVKSLSGQKNIYGGTVRKRKAV